MSTMFHGLRNFVLPVSTFATLLLQTCIDFFLKQNLAKRTNAPLIRSTALVFAQKALDKTLSV